MVILNLNEPAGVDTSMDVPVDRSGQPTRPLTTGQQIAIYLGTLAGTILSPALAALKTGTAPQLSLTAITILISVAVSFVVIAIMYSAGGIKTGAPHIVQVGYAVQNGLFWQTIIGPASSGK